MKHLLLYNTLENAVGKIANTPVVAMLKTRNKPTYGSVKLAKEVEVLKEGESDITFIETSQYRYFTFEALEDNSSVYLFKRANPLIERNVNLQYSLNGGKTWIEYQLPEAGENGPSILFNKGEKILFKGDNPEGFNECYYDSVADKYINNLAFYFLGTGKLALSGNVMSLLFNNDFSDKILLPNTGCFGRLCQGNTSLYEITGLCFGGAHDGQLDTGCNFFYLCTNLTYCRLDEVPNSLVNGFRSCTNLEIIKADWTDAYILQMLAGFYECNKLTSIGNTYNWNLSKTKSTLVCFGCTNVSGTFNFSTIKHFDMEIFHNVQNPISLIFGESLEELGDNYTIDSDFNDCFPMRLIHIEIPESNPYFKVSNGIVYSKDGTKCYGGSATGDVSDTIDIEEGVLYLMPGAFRNCMQSFDTYCSKLILPSTITILGDRSVLYASTCDTVIVNAVEPPTIISGTTFMSMSPNLKVYVPDESVDAYKANSNWDRQWDKIYPLSEYMTGRSARMLSINEPEPKPEIEHIVRNETFD